MKLSNKLQNALLGIGRFKAIDMVTEWKTKVLEVLDVNTNFSNVYHQMRDDICKYNIPTYKLVDYHQQLIKFKYNIRNESIKIRTLIGQVLYKYRVATGATIDQLGEIFDWSRSKCSAAIRFYELTVEFPTFLRLCIPFSVVLKNITTFRKYLRNASPEECIFWTRK